MKPTALLLAFLALVCGSSLAAERPNVLLISFTQWSDGTSELYDHDADPEETRDLSRLAEHNATFNELKARLRSLPLWPATK
jgi:hypothetical protein